MRTVINCTTEYWSTKQRPLEYFDNVYSKYKNKMVIDLTKNDHNICSMAMRRGLHDELCLKYNITPTRINVSPEERIQMIKDYIKEKNIKSRHELRNDKKGSKHFHWLIDHQELCKDILPSVLKNYSVEDIRRIKREGEELNIKFHKYDSRAYQVYLI
jgi:hypothetical protein